MPENHPQSQSLDVVRLAREMPSTPRMTADCSQMKLEAFCMATFADCFEVQPFGRLHRSVRTLLTAACSWTTAAGENDLPVPLNMELRFCPTCKAGNRTREGLDSSARDVLMCCNVLLPVWHSSIDDDDHR